MELFIINNHVADVLAAKGIRVYKTYVGEYMTSLEMEASPCPCCGWTTS